MGSVQQQTWVVAAAVVRDGRVLVARRTTPPAGRWELPGGKVEPGESREQALAREWREEFGVDLEVVAWLDESVAVGPGLELQIALAEVRGEPVATEHDRVRWLAPEEFDDVDWLDGDRALLPALRARLDLDAAEGARGLFFERDDADAVAVRLRSAGYLAEVRRERLAGEDDDEDHPWAVSTDGPAVALDLLVEEFDGWLEHPESARPGASSFAPAVAPPDLPTGPRRPGSLR